MRKLREDTELMNYGNIAENVLSIEVEEDFEQGTMLTLKEVLDQTGEDIIHAVYKLKNKEQLQSFTAWTENNILVLNVDGMMSSIIIIPRNPPVKSNS